MQSRFSKLFAAICWLLMLISARQVSGQFNEVIDVPSAPNIGDFQSVSSDTQINLHAGGMIGHHFSVGASDGTSTNVELNINGGMVDHTLAANNGSTVNVLGGSVGSHFAATNGSAVNISAGVVGPAFLAADGSTVNISGGSIGRFSQATGSGVINLSDGSIGDSFAARSGSTVNISGGIVGDSFDAFGGSTVNISGGTVGSLFDARSGSIVNLSGGSLGPSFDMNSGSELNIFGSRFALSGIDISNTLTPNTPFVVSDRNVPLTGLLTDGSSFSFQLDTGSLPSQNDALFPSDATVTITLVPEPTSFALCAVAVILLIGHRKHECHCLAN